ncbi:retrovirus-related pol polyprotein from transposon TNT 1-94 [Tanacetum coccineum]
MEKVKCDDGIKRLGHGVRLVDSARVELAGRVDDDVQALQHVIGGVVVGCPSESRDLQGNDLVTGTRGSDLYTIALHESFSPTPMCFMAKASTTQTWLWHRRLSHLNFDTINLILKNDTVNGLPKLKFVKNHLCLSCKLGKAKRSNFKKKTTPSSKGRFCFTWTYVV